MIHPDSKKKTDEFMFFLAAATILIAVLWVIAKVTR